MSDGTDPGDLELQAFDFSDFITVRIFSLLGLFKTHRQFVLPWEQRAYAWQEEHATRLLGDLIEAFNAPEQRYFLGYISVAEPQPDNSVSLIDGQQRLVTLTILFAYLRDQIANPGLKTLLGRCVWSGPDSQRRKPMILMQDHVQHFFLDAVQNPDATHASERQQSGFVAECEKHIANNLSAIVGVMEERAFSQGELEEFATFLLSRCGIVLQTVATEREAWEIMATEEETGLGFHSSERSKVTLISAMPRDVQAEAGQIWAHWQDRIGTEQMARLLEHITVILTGKSRRGRGSIPVETELLRTIPLKTAGLDFIKSQVAVHAGNVARLLEHNVGDGPGAVRSAKAINWLSWLPFDGWMVPALSWLQKHGWTSPETAQFFFQLERAAWIFHISGADPTKRERAFAQIATEIKAAESLSGVAGLVIEPAVLAAALNNLRSRTFYQKRYSALVLRRLCDIMGMDPGLLDGHSVTCEHVLPGNPPATRAWRKIFSGQHHPKQHADRLGNLVLLSFEDNQRAGTLDWEDKREILAACPFELSKEAAAWPAWDVETISKRTEALVGQLMGDWELPTRIDAAT